MVARSVEPQGLARPTDRYAPVHQHPVDKLALPSRPQSFRRILRPTNDPPDRLLNGLHLQHLPVQRQIGDDLLQAIALILELLEALHLARQQTGIFLLPVEVGRLRDPCFAADLGHQRAFLALLQNKRSLRFRELRCLHRSQLISQPRKRSRKLQIQTVQFSGSRAVNSGAASIRP